MNFGYSLSAIFSMLLLIFAGSGYGGGNIGEAEDYKFRQLMWWMAFYCAIDAAWGAFYSGMIFSPLGFTIACYVVYFMAGVVTLIWFNYILDSIGGRTVVKNVLSSVAAIILIIQVLVLISNYFTHELFFINSEGDYFRSGGRIQIQLLQNFNYLLILCYGLKRIFSVSAEKKKAISRMTFFSLVPAVFGLGQILFFDAAMYSLGFAAAALSILLFDRFPMLMQSIDKEHREERLERLSIINGLAGNFSTIYSIDLNTNGFIVYNRTDDDDFLKKVDNSKLNYFKVALEKGRRMVHEDDLEKFLLIMDKEAILKRFEKEQSFSVVLRINFGKSFRYVEYRFTDNHIGMNQSFVIGVYDVDKSYRKRLRDAEVLKDAKERQIALEEEAMLLDRAAHRDIMTGLYNRRAYEDYLEKHGGMPDGKDFIYVAIDLNGLKAINDDVGHEAGDELIKGAAFCMKKVLGEYGFIYRHGGDEFSAMLHAPGEKIEDIFKKLDDEFDEYQGKFINGVSASYGYATVEESGDISISELAKIADQRMYVSKNHYYARKGIDRRGQQEAYDVIRKSYLKILKVDLKEDSFASIYMDESETTEDKGYDDKISKWIHDFATSGNVHPDDCERFIGDLELNRIREHFREGRENIAIHYRRKTGGEYSNALLELIPSADFSEKDQIVYLYVKNIY